MKLNRKSSAIRLGVPGLFVALAIAGCEVGPSYKPPMVQGTDDWGEQGREPTTRGSATTLPSRTVSRPPPLVEWWTTFHDPQLDDLIMRALRANIDVRIATARVREARAQRGVVRADLFPQVNATGQYQHVRPSENGVASAFGGSAQPVNAGGTGTNAPGAGGSAAIPGASLGELDLYQAGFDANWELDIFGKRRRAVEAADAQVGAALEQRREVLVSLMAEVARNYVELRAAQQRLSIARNNLMVQQRTLRLTAELSERGLNNAFDVSRARAQVATTMAQVPPLETSLSEAIHRLSILIDQRPTALAEELVTERPMPSIPDSVPVGLPSDLLRRRPDIRRAERQLAAATANIGVATADLYPQFSLTGSLGLQSTDITSLFDYGSRFYSFGPSVSWPLFDAGRIRENVHVREARQEQAVLSYRQSILTALREVEDGLVAFAKSQERSAALRDAVAANETAVRIANDLYGRGLTDFLSVLDAQRSLLESQDMLASSQSETATRLIALYKSLGGGWEFDAISEHPSSAAEGTSVR